MSTAFVFTIKAKLSVVPIVKVPAAVKFRGLPAKVKVLPDNVSVPVKVANVPEAGSVTDEPPPAAANVTAPTVVVSVPAITILPVRSIVLAASLTMRVRILSAPRFSVTTIRSSSVPAPDESRIPKASISR